VLNDADLEEAAEGIIQSAFTTTGQRCTAASRVIVENSVKDQLIEKLIEKTTELKVGNGLEKDTKMGPVVNEKQLKSIETYVERAVQEGGEIKIGGRRLEKLDGFFY